MPSAIWLELKRVYVATVFLIGVGWGIHSMQAAFKTEDLSTGLKHILADPWATVTLADYAAGLVLSIPLLNVAGPTQAQCIAWTVLQLVFGNVILLIRFTLLIITQGPSLKESIQPNWMIVTGLTAIPNTTSRWDHVRLNILRVACLILGGLYAALATRALVLESTDLGWRYIRTEQYSWLTFVDTMLGVIFTGVYLAVREEKLSVWIPLVLVLWFCGNIVTAAYVFWATFGAANITDALLTRRPVLTRHALYQPIA